MKEYDRIQKILDIQDDSVFLWGARQVGKSTLVKKLFPDAKVYDLLKSDEYSRLLRKPQLLREELVSYDETKIVIIDEIQKIPSLLDEVHWLIVNRGIFQRLCFPNRNEVHCLPMRIQDSRSTGHLRQP